MGRRAVSLEDDERWVFNRLAQAYASRPPYPEALVDRLVALSGGAGARVADLGAGTGHLALPLCARGLWVTAVEPAKAMLEVLLSRRPSGARLRAVHARAEATGLAGSCFELVLLADAAQWVDHELTGREVARLLSPGGVLALVEARFSKTPFMDGLSAALTRRNPRARGRKVSGHRELFAVAMPGFVPAAETYRQECRLDEEALEGLLRSLSYVGPALGPAALGSLFDEVRRLARDAGSAAFSRDLTLHFGARPAP
ncbi:MAG TPA: class I SAM-dependent methyltransferase [Anaeromyxobacteraceae bacterium]|nr:class I SAM-dependent methyltransferase [Anaeromyxobacteraceae bacterium]